MKPVRNSAKAVIIQDGKLLTIQCLSWKNEVYYLFPGGGQNPGETLTGALLRECREEIGAEIEIEVEGLKWVREYIADNHEFAASHAGFHAVEFMFLCKLKPGTELVPASQPDSYQTGIAWLPLESLHEKKFFPQAMIPLLQGKVQAHVDYLGDVN